VFGGLLQLGGEGGSAVGVDLGEILLADVQVGPQRQGHDVPVGVMDDPGGGDPDVAVEVVLVGGSRGGVVVKAGSFDVGAIALGGGVVEGEPPARSGIEGASQVPKQDRGEGVDLGASEGAQ
jgi:hypothetical protein